MTREIRMGVARRDVYCEAAAAMFNLVAKVEVTPLQRRQAKRACHALIWDTPLEKIAAGNNCTVEDVRRLASYISPARAILPEPRPVRSNA